MRGKRKFRVSAAATAYLAAFVSSCAPAPPAPILLFNGIGTSRGDVAALEQLLTDNRYRYDTAGASRLNSMSESGFRAHRLLIIPGGNFEEIGKNLTPAARERIRTSVRGGLNYLGICAGAFLAGDSRAGGFNLTGGVVFPFYSAEARGVRKEAVWIQSASGPALQHYWEDGPALSGWGEVVGKYPDGAAAVVQGPVGEGWVVLSGVHPEAPESWRTGMNFTTPATLDQAYAKQLIDAALHRTRLAHF